MIGDSSKAFRYGVPVLIGSLLLARLVGMAAVPLMDSTEARYGEIGRKMVELNDWITPWFDYGVPYWGKPPLSFWVTAISFKLFGVNEFTARLPHLLIALAIVGLVGWFAARRDRDAVLPAVACISGSFLFFISAGAVMVDIELVLGTSLAMAGFWIALETPGAEAGQKTGRNIGWCGASMFFAGLILGLLAKGPVTLVLAGGPLLLWTAYNQRWLDVWRRLPWVGGVVLTLLIALPWYWLAERHTHGFLEYFLIGEHWNRFVTPGWEGDRYGNAHIFPIGTIWAFAFVDTLPWSVLLPLAAWRWRKKAIAPTVMANGLNAAADERAWQSYLWFWMLTPLLFFTTARNIIMTYVLPALPAAAIWAGGWLARQQLEGRQVNRWLCAGLLCTLLVMSGVAIANLSLPDKMEHKSVKALLAAYDRATGRGLASPAAQSSGAGAAPTRAPLIFVWSRPFSAQFYSRGEAIKVTREAQAWRRIGAGAGYVATLSGDEFIANAAEYNKVGDAPGETGGERGADAAAVALPRTVTRLGRYGDFDLLFVAKR